MKRPVLMREAENGRWRHYSVIRDEGLTLIEMEPALLGGWNVTKITAQGSKEWGGMSANEIKRWILSNRDDVEVFGRQADAVLELLERR